MPRRVGLLGLLLTFLLLQGLGITQNRLRPQEKAPTHLEAYLNALAGDTAAPGRRRPSPTQLRLLPNR